MPTHINFIKYPNPNKKTQKWRVRAKSDNYFLGEISWFARWYQYSFFPQGNTVFEKTCLRDIAQFCDEQTKIYRAGWKKGLNARKEKS